MSSLLEYFLKSFPAKQPFALVLKMARHMICFKLRDSGKYSAVIVMAFYSRKDRISFARFVSLWLELLSIFTTNVRATILYIWTWIDLSWNILVKRTKCAAFNSKIFMCMSDSCLLYGPLLAGPCLKRRHNNTHSLPSHVKWNTEKSIVQVYFAHVIVLLQSVLYYV